MYVFLVHHAEALDPVVDPHRPLSRVGRVQADWLALHAHSRGVSPAAVWHSGKRRARETAECFLRVCNPFAIFRMVRGLQPGDPTAWMEDALAAEDQDILVVGHLPHLPELARQLAGSESLPLHGMICLERGENRRYVEQWRAQPPVDLGDRR